MPSKQSVANIECFYIQFLCSLCFLYIVIWYEDDILGACRVMIIIGGNKQGGASSNSEREYFYFIVSLPLGNAWI